MKYVKEVGKPNRKKTQVFPERQPSEVYEVLNDGVKSPRYQHLG